MSLITKTGLASKSLAVLLADRFSFIIIVFFNMAVLTGTVQTEIGIWILYSLLSPEFKKEISWDFSAFTAQEFCSYRQV